MHLKLQWQSVMSEPTSFFATDLRQAQAIVLTLMAMYPNAAVTYEPEEDHYRVYLYR